MKVSVIIPCYNVELYIKECIESVLSQTYDDIEIICVNDGSTDDTLEILKNIHLNSNFDIKLITQENGGAASARNTGFKNSSSQYLQFLDADDILDSSKIERQMNLANENNFPDLIVGSFERRNMKGELLYRREYIEKDETKAWLYLMKTDLGNTCSNLFKATAFEEGLIWNQDLPSSQEYELMFRLLQKDVRIVFDKQCKTIIRERDSGSISQTNIVKKWEIHAQQKVAIYSYLEEASYDLNKNEILQALFESIRMLYSHNSSLALQFYLEFFSSKFVPAKSSLNSRLYIFTFRLIGFRFTEKIRKILNLSKAK